MQNIHIRRPKGNPDLAAAIEPEDRSWLLAVDQDGVPHLWLRTSLGTGEDGQVQHGYLNVEDVLPEEMCFKDLMRSEFTEPCTEAEADAAMAELERRRETRGGPCCPPRSDR